MVNRELHRATLTRRQVIQSLTTILLPAMGRRTPAAQVATTEIGPLDFALLPAGIRSRFVDNVNGLRMHVLEAGFETPGRRALLLLHGFPELAYSWRKVMPMLAAAGYHVIAPDQRGYGRTSGWDDSYDAEPDPFRILNMVRDAMSLVLAL